MSEVSEMGAKYLAEAISNDVPAGYKQTEVGVIPEDWDETFARKMISLSGEASCKSCCRGKRS